MMQLTGSGCITDIMPRGAAASEAEKKLMVEQRTALANQTRSLAAEQGTESPVGIHILQQRLIAR